MKYLWDTDICVHFLNGNKKIVQKTQTIGAENICATISYGLLPIIQNISNTYQV
jgi:hypothetical protein